MKSRAGSKKGIQEGQVPACLGSTVRRGAPSPLGIAAKPVMVGIRSSCLPPAHGLFAKTTVNARVPKQAQP